MGPTQAFILHFTMVEFRSRKGQLGRVLTNYSCICLASCSMQMVALADSVEYHLEDSSYATSSMLFFPPRKGQY